MRRPVPRAIAVSICLSIAIAWLFVPGQKTAFAFSSLANAIVDAKTAKFKMEVMVEGTPVQKSQAYYLAPERMRVEMSVLGIGSVSISDEATSTMLMLMPLTKTAVLTKGKGKPKDQPSNNPFIQFRQLLDTKRNDTRDNPFRPIGQKEIEGKMAHGFRAESALGTFTIWGDLATGRLLRTESVFSGPRKNEVVMSDIEINVDLDEKLFELTPPDGYSVQMMEVDLSPPSEKSLVESFRFCGEISGGELPESISFLEPMTFYFRHAKDRVKDLKNQENINSPQVQAFAKELQIIQRGFTFAMGLPESANAYYAGKGVKVGTPSRPIFWYLPKDSKAYRVIDADLSVRETDTAPSIDGAVRLVKPDSQSPAAQGKDN